MPALEKALAEHLAELKQYLSTHGHWPTRHAACPGRKLVQRLAKARIERFSPLDDKRFKALRDHWCLRMFTPPRVDDSKSSVGVGQGVALGTPSKLSPEVAGAPMSSKRLPAAASTEGSQGVRPSRHQGALTADTVDAQMQSRGVGGKRRRITSTPSSSTTLGPGCAFGDGGEHARVMATAKRHEGEDSSADKQRE